MLLSLSTVLFAATAVAKYHPSNYGAGVHDVGPVVFAPAGAFRGSASQYRPKVTAYLGIPFAKPPTGTLRFEAPVRLRHNRVTGIVNATKFGS
jgi:Carboxylesterase family